MDAQAAGGADDVAPRPTRRRAATRERLLDAAFETLAREGAGAATVEAVCERAGFTRGAFYSNFSTMEELFLALFDRQAAALAQRVEAALEPLGDDDDAAADAAGRPLEAVVASAVESVLAAGGGDRGWWLVSTEQVMAAARSPAARLRLAEHQRALRRRLGRALAAALARAGRRLLVSEDDLARLVLAVHDGGVAQSLVEPDDVPYGRLDRLALPPLLLGITEPA